MMLSDTNPGLNPNSNTSTTAETYTKLDIMHDEFRKRIKSLPLVTQYAFIELFSKYYNTNFTRNPIVARSILQFNTMDLSGSDDEFKKRIIVSGLKILSDELCPIFVASNTEHGHPELCYNVMTRDEITDYLSHSANTDASLSKLPIYATNRNALTAYFRIIRELIETLDVQTIKDILLDDFAQYEYTITAISKYSSAQTQTTVDYLKNKVFDGMKKLDLELVKVSDEQRFDRFEECCGTIVLMVEDTNRILDYYLVFDVLTKKIFMFDCDDYRGYEVKLRTDDFVVELDDKNKNDYDKDNDDDDNESSTVTNTSTNTNTITSHSQTQSSNNLFTNAFIMCILFTIIVPILIVGLILGFWLYNSIHDFFYIYQTITEAISEPKFSSLG